MPVEPITPGSPNHSVQDELMEDAPAGAAMLSKPVQVPYSREFEDGVMRAVLEPPAPDGIEVREPMPAYLLHRDPDIGPDELPLPLDDPRRQFKSDVPGVRLTHPKGAYEGGPGEMDAEDKEFVLELIEKHGVRAKADLDRAIAVEKEAANEDLRQRMRARKEAIEDNERIERELKVLNDQREVELRAQRSIIEKEKARKEERKTKKMKPGPSTEVY